MRDVDAARRDFAAFVELAGHPPLADFQLESVRLEAPVSAIVSPRGAGKSTVLALLALHWAFTHPGELVLIVSASEDAARRLLATAKRFAIESEVLRASVTDELAGLLSFTNGASIRSVAASEQAIRGWRASLLLIDEASVIGDPLILSAAMPTVSAAEHGRIVLASSASAASGAFFDAVNRAEAGDPHSRAFRWRLADCLAWVSPTVVEALRASMSPTRFSAEMLGEFASGSDSLFSRSALERVTVDYVAPALGELAGPARLLGGLDWGERADRSAFVAIGRLPGPERRFAVASVRRWEAGAPVHDVVEEVVGSRAHFHLLAAEANGMGGPCCQILERAFARRSASAGGGSRRARRAVVMDVEALDALADRRRRRADRVVLPAPEGAPRPAAPFSTRLRRVWASSGSKAATWSALRLLIDRQRLLLPASATDLLRELLTLRVSLTSSGAERIEAPGTAADDVADALGVAAYPYQRDGQWRAYLQDLADPALRLREPMVDAALLERLPMVSIPGGGELPRTPAFASVFGPEVTLPSGVIVADPAVAIRARRADLERRVREANRP